ncbi:cytochrome c oxidase assembly protein [Kaistia adipata]|uniref:cytochrome c oxidase assembly protein n=1 Tax=Kaistia adipata TaxID=166954 RepID=UPI0004914A00|nr:cytochrome c oxidase assembly protein [Kaistia adipata]
MSKQQPGGRSHGVTAIACGVFVLTMLGAAFASVPLYDMFCRVTGYGGTPVRADAAPDKKLNRTITVRFDGNVANGIGWAFRPEQRQIKVKVGEINQVNFVAENRTDRSSTGTATFNVTPELTGQYFNKIACFCFTSQTLKPGERVEMPVTFFIDPAIDENAQARFIDTITLSYTFFPSSEEAPAPVAAVKTQAQGSSL